MLLITKLASSIRVNPGFNLKNLFIAAELRVFCRKVLLLYSYKPRDSAYIRRKYIPAALCGTAKCVEQNTMTYLP